MKGKRILFLSTIVILILGGCKKEDAHLSDEEITKIIEDFSNTNYEYKTTHFLVVNETKEEVSVSEGTVIAEPYEQYEKVTTPDYQGMTEQYWRTADQGIEYYIVLGVNDASKDWQLISQEAAKGNDMYVRDDLEFEFSRTEMLSDEEINIYQAEYTATSMIHDDFENLNSQMEFSYIVTVEYFINPKTQNVEQVRIFDDSGKKYEIVNQMNQGMSRQEAEEFVEKNGYEKVEQNVEIVNSGKEFKTPLVEF